MAQLNHAQLAKLKKSLRLFRWVGVALVVFGIGVGVRTLLFLNAAETTTATVVSVRSDRSGTGRDRTTVYYPTVRFFDHEDNAVTAETRIGSSSFNFRPGQEVAVRFLPENPTRFEIDSFMSLWGFTVIPLIIGIGSIGITFFPDMMQQQAVKTGATNGAHVTKPSATVDRRSL